MKRLVVALLAVVVGLSASTTNVGAEEAPPFLFKWGTLCVMSTGSGCLDRDGPGPLELGDGQFRYPNSVAVGSGDVYVSDAGNERIQKFDSSGGFLLKWGSRCIMFTGAGCVDPDGPGPLELGDGQFNNPAAVAVDASGNVYISDTLNNRIQKFDSSGGFLLKWGSRCVMFTGDGCVDPDGPGPLQLGDGQFDPPQGVAVDSSGNVYVADWLNYRVQKFDSSGGFLLKCCVGGSGVAVDGAGNIYVADDGNSSIQKFDSSGSFLLTWGTQGAGDGQFENLWGVAVDGSGNVYATDPGCCRVQKFDSSGRFLSKWGTLGAGDGEFWTPVGVAVDGSGKVYVADSGNDRIQVFGLGPPPPPLIPSPTQWGLIAMAGLVATVFLWRTRRNTSHGGSRPRKEDPQPSGVA